MNYFISILLLSGIGAANGIPLNMGVFNPIIVDPQFNAYESTQFKLLTPENRENPINFSLSCIPKLQINKDRKTLIVIHGFSETDYMTELFKAACFENGNHDVNLIGVDWTAGSQDPSYIYSTLRVERVGKVISRLIGLAVIHNYMNLNTAEIVGHSLGAHVAGFAGKHLQWTYDLKLPLIIGLDPAGPLFTTHNNKLQRTDAEKVVVIHTNDDYGHLEPFGGVDIYLNGGKKQPGLNDQESHCFAAEFYKGLLNIKCSLIAHPYKSFDEIQYGITPATCATKLFHGEPYPRDGTMLFVDTYFTQKSALPEFEKLDFSRIPPPSSIDELRQCVNCAIL